MTDKEKAQLRKTINGFKDFFEGITNTAKEEKTADEMFEELGYYINKKPECENCLLFYVKCAENEDDPYEYIVFHKNKTITTVCNDRAWTVVITKEILHAINKKVEELQWI